MPENYTKQDSHVGERMVTPSHLIPHEAATLFPSMSEDEYQALKADIAEHGQREPVVLMRDRYSMAVIGIVLALNSASNPR